MNECMYRNGGMQGGGIKTIRPSIQAAFLQSLSVRTYLRTKAAPFLGSTKEWLSAPEELAMFSYGRRRRRKVGVEERNWIAAAARRNG